MINRFSKMDEINITDAEKALGKKVSWRLPNFYMSSKIPRIRASRSSSSSPLPMAGKESLRCSKGLLEEMISQPIAA